MTPIPLSIPEQEQCYAFAEEVVKRSSQRPGDFGGPPRAAAHIRADQTEGKMAELILQKFLGDLGLPVEVDFNHYNDQLETDVGDVLPAKYKNVDLRLDVKGSSYKAQWLLVERWKMVNEKRPSGFASDLYVMVKFTDSFPGNPTCRKDNRLLLSEAYSGNVVGWATAEQFQDPTDRQFWFVYEQDSKPYRMRCLPNTPPRHKGALTAYLKKSVPSVRAQGDDPFMQVDLKARLNYGLPLKWLRQDWDELIRRFRTASR